MKGKLGIVGLLIFAFGTAAVADEPVRNKVHFTHPVYSGRPEQGPKLIKKRDPIYPMRFRQPGNHGFAELAFIVDEKGVPIEIQCVRASDKAFATVTIDAVKHWRYEPAKLNGKPVATVILQKMTFGVDDGER